MIFVGNLIVPMLCCANEKLFYHTWQTSYSNTPKGIDRKSGPIQKTYGCASVSSQRTWVGVPTKQDDYISSKTSKWKVKSNQRNK